MFLHDYLLACEISTVRTQTLDRNTFRICVVIFCYGRDSCIPNRSSNIVEKPGTNDSRSICKQNTQLFLSEKFLDLIMIFFPYKYQFRDVYKTASLLFIAIFFSKQFLKKQDPSVNEPFYC